MVQHPILYLTCNTLQEILGFAPEEAFQVDVQETRTRLRLRLGRF